MKKVFPIFLGILIFAGIGEKGLAQCSNGITLNTPSATSGSISASGSYTVGSGYTFVSISLLASPTGGSSGEGGQNNSPTVQMMNFNGNITVPGGYTYDVQAVLTVSDSSGTNYNFFLP